MYNIIIMNLTIILYNGSYINTTLQLDAQVQRHFQVTTLQLDAMIRHFQVTTLQLDTLM